VFNSAFAFGILLTPWFGSYVIAAFGTTGLLYALAAMGFALLPYLLAARIEKMQRVSERSGNARLERFEQIVAAEPKGRLRARLAEAGWYRTTPASFALRATAGGVRYGSRRLRIAATPERVLRAEARNNAQPRTPLASVR